MNFLSKTFSTLTGTSIPYSIKEEIPLTKSIWTIYNGSNPKTDGSPVTIFELNLNEITNRQNVSLGKNSFKKLKLIKFPGIISIIDFIENDNYLYIITEPVIPLSTYLKDNGPKISQDAKSYGIYNIAESILFINMKCQCIHGNLSVFNDSVFVNDQGDWKLFGFDLLTNLTSDPDQPIYRLSDRSPSFRDGLPEDVISQGIESIKNFPIKLDSYKLGVFIYTLLSNEDFTSIDYSNFNNSDLINVTNGRFPRSLITSYKKLISNKPNLRITVEKFLQESKQYFNSNKLIGFNKQLQEIQFKNDEEKLTFFKYELSNYISDENSNDEIQFPPLFLDNKLLPELIKQFNNLYNFKPTINTTLEETQQRQETISVLLNYILKFGSNLSEIKFNKMIKPIILNSFSLSDRSIRLILLTHLPNYTKFLTESDIQLKIFYNVITGFQDTNFMIREITLTSITSIIDKVSVKQVNQDLLKVLAKSQMDPKPSIRTNTLILIIKISSKIYSNSRNNVLITALAKSLRDSFTPCKMMALSGFEKLIETFSLDEICNKILGHLAISLMDNKSHKVRLEAKRIFELYLQSVEKHASTLPNLEEDEDAEEKEFFRKHAPNNELAQQISENNQVSNSIEGNKIGSDENNGSFSFGWNIVNKLVSSSAIDGQLNNEFNKSTPDLTRVTTPTTKAETKASDKSWLNDLNNEFDDLNDGWDNEEEEEEEALNDNITTNYNIDKNQTFGNTASKPNSNNKNKSIPISKRSNSVIKEKKGSSLKLGKTKEKKPGSTLKLDLTMDEDDVEDGWGVDGW